MTIMFFFNFVLLFLIEKKHVHLIPTEEHNKQETIVVTCLDSESLAWGGDGGPRPEKNEGVVVKDPEEPRRRLFPGDVTHLNTSAALRRNAKHRWFRWKKKKKIGNRRLLAVVLHVNSDSGQDISARKEHLGALNFKRRSGMNSICCWCQILTELHNIVTRNEETPEPPPGIKWHRDVPAAPTFSRHPAEAGGQAWLIIFGTLA